MMRIETILILVLKFKVDCACFHGEEANLCKMQWILN